MEVYKKALETGPRSHGDPSIWSHLLRVRDPDTHRLLSEKQMLGETGILFFAGAFTWW
jgi:cytochrome P450